MKIKHAHIGVLCNNHIPHSASIRFLDLSSIIRVHFPVTRHAKLPEKYSLHSENASCSRHGHIDFKVDDREKYK